MGLLILGRDEERAQIATFLEGSLPAALIIDGSAGIGKTTLWREGVTSAASRGYTVLTCSPSASETQLAYSAVGDLIGEIFDDTTAGIPLPQRNALEVALLRKPPEGITADQRAVAVAFLASLRSLASTARILLAVDDVQWLDQSSSAALTFAVRRLRNEPIALLWAHRTDGEELPLQVEHATFAPEALLRITLGPLSMGALHRLLRARLDLSLTRPVLRRIHETSGGNPFFALEIGGALKRRQLQVSPGEQLPVPLNLRQLVQDRLATVPPEARGVLPIVAALSKPTVELVEAALGERDVWPLLRPTLDEQVLELEGQSLRFTHPLVAHAVRSELDPGTRRRIHRRLAEVVPDLEERARHLGFAAEGEDRGSARVLDEAARVAAGRGAAAAAAELAELAARLTPPEDASDRGRRLVMAGEQFFLAGENRRAQEMFEEQLAVTPPGPERAEVLFKVSVPVGEDDADAGLELMDQALEESGADDRLRAPILLILCEERLLRLDLDGAAKDAHEAHEIGNRLGDPAIRVPALVHVPLVDLWRGDGLDREALEEAMELEVSLPNPEGYWTPSHILGSGLVFHDRLDEARPILRVEYERGPETNELERNRSAFYLAELELRAGNWQRAARFAEEALEGVEQMGIAAGIGRYLYPKAFVDAHLGRIEEARAAAHRGLSLVGKVHESSRLRHLTVLGFIETSLGRHEQALEHIGSVADVLAQRRVGEPGIFLFEADELEARISLGQLDRAEARIDAIEERGRRLDRPRELVCAQRGRGLLLAARGDLDGARSSLERALSESDRLPVPFERGRTLLALGKVLRRTKQRGAARGSLERSLSLFQDLGAPLWAVQSQAELARIGGRARARDGTLTETERRVAELVAEGRSNKEVAAALFVTAKTVETNLIRIYRKLGIHSRAALAHKLASEARPPSEGQSKL